MTEYEVLTEFDDVVCHCCLKESSDSNINLWLFDTDFFTLVCTTCWYLLYHGGLHES